MPIQAVRSSLFNMSVPERRSQWELLEAGDVTVNLHSKE